MNRVVITGFGVASPIGNDEETFLKNLKEGNHGFGPITRFDASQTGITLAAEVKDFPLEKYFIKKDTKRMETYSLYAIYSAFEALKMSGIDTEQEDMERFGVMIGSGVGGLGTIQDQVLKMDAKGPARVSPMFVPLAIVNMAAGNVALRIGAKGICISTVTACASGTHSIGEAFRNIKHGYSDVIIAGGAESCINKIGISGFAALTALSTSEDPQRASIPFDTKRDGFVMGEGAGVLVLESLEHAQKRGAKILGEIVGYGATCDAYHMTAPSPDGEGAARAIKEAIKEAGITPADVNYVNAHGTSTQANDKAESQAIETALTKNAYVSSTKSLTGHLLGGAGGVEAIASLLAIQHQFIPPTANIQEVDPEIKANIVVNEAKETPVNYAVSNSLGFGGHNAVICLKRWED
ncbi:beta-ketoacyl-ACP synthase II [Enterococcus dongliensis]|uniref:3-oxoacyl-[acyl-carrier-protein] synthase 2 n=1 Tax=Enterococcus dongliensis TaxID=2559925 RepID=A0ABU3ERK5_9ENTE|nr:beta-ketoacyl-ACP synthase II [Enterococcus dongliensis]MDT2597490.1 beta-ketoacyl-ACP synthase II [Enterococcus dongliensis]MDT2603066.1 beta-ketoacyl-ACP synthase II [Enterococcus dongliensis]MDT2644504.1 beta-ketoacyl-ACP synthase II [Enterococcus dongliensis]MDT2670762.1 beta-ketoacyl-ACP synthase II [Enterococcus dongliensis]MDT2675507.1 beta-ketoacyl-ACP synthase II [Enterococcus dongliensis]